VAFSARRRQNRGVERIGPYEVLEELARGGTGVVYRARDGRTGRAAAVKVLLTHRGGDDRARRRTQTELLALVRLRHPHVVQALDAGTHGETPYLALELIEGESLEDRLQRRGPLPVDEAVRLGRELAAALEHAHAYGVLHRDLKPDNVLLRAADGAALLTDFGLALDVETSLSRISRTGMFLGTPGYWPPEQARGELDALGPTADVYGLGAVLYAALTGSPPVEGRGLVDYLQTVRFRRIRPVRAVQPEVPAWLSDVCRRCLEPEPTDRYRSAGEVGCVLGAGAGAIGGVPRDAPPPIRRPRWVGPVALGAAVAGVVAVGVAASAVLAERRRDRLRAELHALAERGDDPDAVLAFAATLPDDLRREAPIAERVAALEAGVAVEAAREAAVEELGRLAGVADFDERLAIVEAALAHDDTYARAYVERARIRYALARRDALEREVVTRSALTQSALDDVGKAIAAKPDAPEPYLFRAELEVVRGDRAGARSSLRQVIQLDDGALGSLAAGLREALGRNWDAAIEHYDAAVRADHRLVAAYLARAEAAIAIGDDPQALRDAQEALRLDPSSASALTLRAEARYHASSDREGALADLDRAIALDGASTHALALRAYVRLERDVSGWDILSAEADLDASEDDARTALRVDQDEPLAYLALGEVLKTRGNEYLGRALQNATRACEWGRNMPETFLFRGRLRALQGDEDNARSDFEAVIRLTNNRPGLGRVRARALTVLAGILVNKESYLEARNKLSAAMELDPSLPDVYFYRGRVFQADKDAQGRQYDQAIADFSAAINRKPDFAAAYFYRAACYFDLRRYDESLEDLEKAESLREDNDRLGGFPMHAALYVRANCYYQRQDWRLAVDAFKAFLDAAPLGSRSAEIARERLDEVEAHLAEGEGG